MTKISDTAILNKDNALTKNLEELKGSVEMNLLSIMGSPKKGGNTALALVMFEERMKEAGHSVVRINAVDVNVGGCAECYVCTRKNDTHGCPQKDDWDHVFQEMLSADAIVYATPLFCFDLSAQLKPIIDRHFSLMNKELLRGKYTALLITCGGEEENNADCLQVIFKRAFDIKKSKKFSTKVVGSYVVPSSVNPGFADRAKKVAEKMCNDFIMAFQDKAQA